MIIHGDCLDVMAGMDPESVDAIVTDPPYGLGFMGKAWDHGVPARPFWEQMLRVAKPSSYLLAFGGTRTVHRIATNIEDAGWIIRDMLVWAYASGFPKSKASLKPAWEPIVMARKPGPLRMLAIDECRIPTDGERIGGGAAGSSGFAQGYERGDGFAESGLGRWPANVILTDPIFDGGTCARYFGSDGTLCATHYQRFEGDSPKCSGWVEGVVGGGEQRSQQTRTDPQARVGESMFGLHERGQDYLGDSGTYSRFFLIPKAGRSDREPVLGGLPWVRKPQTARANIHPTVKPTDLMRHLVRLVTPSGGTVLDPFLGSGTTGLAAEMEGFDWIGIEREAEYVAIAEARLNGSQRGMGLAG